MPHPTPRLQLRSFILTVADAERQACEGVRWNGSCHRRAPAPVGSLAALKAADYVSRVVSFAAPCTRACAGRLVRRAPLTHGPGTPH